MRAAHSLKSRLHPRTLAEALGRDLDDLSHFHERLECGVPHRREVHATHALQGRDTVNFPRSEVPANERA
jgi:hypothetical protein